MSELFGFTGYESFFPGGTIYPNPKGSSIFLSLGHQVDSYFPPCKRSSVSQPNAFSGETFGPKEVSIDVLPDECLFEIFRRLPGGEERSSCACVSKRWLMLLVNIRGNEFCKPEKSGKEIKDKELDSDGYLSRSLDGKKATDVKLAAISIGATNRGGLGKLWIRGSCNDSSVTNNGLKAIANWCPSLKLLSLGNLSSIGDEGIFEIANGCRLLQKLDLSKCHAISDKALLEFAKNCPNLIDITIESCPKIGDEGLQAIGKCCPKLKSVSIKDCPLVGDRGIASLVSSTSYVLNKVKLQNLNITDVSLAVIGHYGLQVTDIVLSGLSNVSERGFWVMGNGRGLQKLKSLTLKSCLGVTDLGLEAVGKGSPNLKQFHLHKGSVLSDTGLVSFAKAAGSLENLHLEECHRISQFGLFGAILNCGTNLEVFSLVNCLGIKDLNVKLPSLPPCKFLRSLSIRNCPGFGNTNLGLVGKLCPQLQHVEFSGLEGITDAGFCPLLEYCEAGLVKVSLSGCVNLTDKIVSFVAEHHGWTLEMLNLDGCRKITDKGLVAIAENCPLLSDLDISKCAITDFGIAALARADHLHLQVLSVSGCSFISDRSLCAFGKLGETLLGLNLQHCKGISRSSVNLLMQQLWRCNIIS